MTENERMYAHVIGKVQGVGYRYFVLRKAEPLGLTGYVRNDPDGSVYVVAEGHPALLDELLQALHRGPFGSVVKHVHSTRSKATGEFNSFSVDRIGSF